MRTFKIGNLVATVPSVIVCGEHPTNPFSHPHRQTIFCMMSEECTGNTCFDHIDNADRDTLTQLKAQLEAAQKRTEAAGPKIQSALNDVNAKLGKT